MKPPSAQKQLNSFFAKYTPDMSKFGKSVRAKMRARLPGAIEMVYDNYNGLVIGYCPNERPSDAILSIVLFPRWVTLCFLQGAGLTDPQRLLKGSGKIVRHLRLQTADDLDKPEIEDLISRALAKARVPIDEAAKSRLIIKSISPTQRPRRPIAK